MDTCLTLGPEMGIAQAAALHEALLAALARAPQRLVLDLGGVTDIDSAGLQLLLATRRSLDDSAQALVIGAASPTVLRALDLFGLRGLFTFGAPQDGAPPAQPGGTPVAAAEAA